MRAGPRDQLITIERKTVSVDDYGSSSAAWTSWATEWAQVIYGTGTERRAAAQEQQYQTATFRVLANSVTSAVTEEDRISFDGRNWDIKSNVPLGRDSREITAVRAPATVPPA